MVRAWVVVSKRQYKQLKKLKEKTGESISGIIREAVSHFVRKKYHPLTITASYLAKAPRDQHKNIMAYFPRSDWDLLVRISQNTRRCETDLVREAVEEYLKQAK